jgi:hypothetical protein
MDAVRSTKEDIVLFKTFVKKLRLGKLQFLTISKYLVREKIQLSKPGPRKL